MPLGASNRLSLAIALFELFDLACDETVLDAGNGQNPIHLDEDGSEFPVIFRCKNARKCWTKFGLEGDYIHGAYLSLL